MWPWGHAAVGYLLYATAVRSARDRSPDAVATIWLAFGTQFPDLVDKPLGWSTGILPTGRTLAHSLLFAVPLCVALYLFCKRRASLRSEWGLAFAIGDLSHVLVDASPPLLRGDPAEARFLLWPLLSVSPYEDGAPTVAGSFASIDPSAYFALQLALAAAAIGWWWRDGRPGLHAAVVGCRTAIVDRLGR